MAVARITKKLVDGLQKTGKQYLVYDEGLTGFGVRVTPNGHRAFMAAFRERMMTFWHFARHRIAQQF